MLQKFLKKFANLRKVLMRNDKQPLLMYARYMDGGCFDFGKISIIVE